MPLSIADLGSGALTVYSAEHVAADVHSRPATAKFSWGTPWFWCIKGSSGSEPPCQRFATRYDQAEIAEFLGFARLASSGPGANRDTKRVEDR
jgi:hypothetical protein